MSTFNPRRAFRDGRTRDLYLTATREGWTHRLDGAGHLAMTSPDGKARMSLSMTARSARSALNTEAVFKRWQRMQAAIDTVIPDNIDYRSTPQEEAPPVTDVSYEELQQRVADEEAHPDELLNKPPYLCADGCGKPVSKPGGYAKGHNPASWANAATARAARATKARNGEATRREPSLFKTQDDRFTISEVIEIANFAGDSGLVEIAKLQKGLTLMLKRAQR